MPTMDKDGQHKTLTFTKGELKMLDAAFKTVLAAQLRAINKHDGKIKEVFEIEHNVYKTLAAKIQA